MDRKATKAEEALPVPLVSRSLFLIFLCGVGINEFFIIQHRELAGEVIRWPTSQLRRSWLALSEQSESKGLRGGKKKHGLEKQAPKAASSLLVLLRSYWERERLRVGNSSRLFWREKWCHRAYTTTDLADRLALKN